jgi:membrane AbrB-like protein
VFAKLALLSCILIAGSACASAHLPASWLIGSMVVSAVFAMHNWSAINVHRNAYLLIQAVIGISLSGTFSPSSLQVLAQHWLPVTLVVVLMMLFTIANAIYLMRVGKVHPATAMLGSLPGGAGEMTAISESFGADPRLVSVIQYVRLLIIILSVSLISHAAGEFISRFHFAAVQVANTEPIRELPPLTLANFAICSAVALSGGWLGTISKIPAGTLMVPMVFALVLSASGHPISWPAPVLAFSYAIMGMMIGARFDNSTLEHLKKLYKPLLSTTVSLMTASVLLACLFVCMMPVNALSSYLAATPGGLDSIAVMASELHADATVVLTVHFLRLILVLLLGPGLVSIFAKYCNKWTFAQKEPFLTYTDKHEKSHPAIRRTPAASCK